MKKLLLLLIIPFLSFGQSVDLEKAKNIAHKFINSDKSHPLTKIGQIHLENTMKNSLDENVLYIFNIDTIGFIMITGDYRMKPVVAYSMEGKGVFDSNQLIPPVNLFLEGVKHKYNNLKNSDLKNEEWDEIENSTSQYNSSFYLMSTTWDQGCYYNNYCPQIPDGWFGGIFDAYCDRAVVGCVATALGQIAKYHNYPNTGNGSIGYYDDDLGYVSADFSAGNYDWANMPNELSFWGSSNTQDNAVAKLLYHMGVASHMNYGEVESGTSAIAAMFGMNYFFNYDHRMKIDFKDNYSFDFLWHIVLKNTLDNNWPIFYSGRAPGSSVGHAYVIDGYNSSDLFHHNFGYGSDGNSPYYNGFYDVDLFFSENQVALLDISPRGNYDFAIYDDIDCVNCGQGLYYTISEESTEIIINTSILFSGNANSYQGNVGCGIRVPGSGNMTIIEEKPVDFNKGYYYNMGFSTQNFNMTPGQYEIIFFYENNDLYYIIDSGISTLEYVDQPGNNVYAIYDNSETLYITQNNSDLSDLVSNKSQIKTVVDILGRENTNKGFQLHIYDDGSVEKKYLIK